MKQNINEIGNTPQGMYTLGQVAGRAYDRMLNGTKQSVGDGIVALNPKYGKVAQDAAYTAAGGYMDWRKKFKEQNGREPSDEEYRAWMQNYKNGCYDYGKPESEKRGVVKISESQLRSMIAESIKGVLNEIGDTPPGQWMLGRLAGRQRNREHPEEISLYTLPIRSQGKISKTTTDANDYGDDDYDSPFQRGFDLENNKWRDNYPDFDLHHADEREESLRGYGDAMTSMIKHHSNKALKEGTEEWYLFTVLKDNGSQILNISNSRDEWDYWRKNGGENYGVYQSYEEATKAMRYFGYDYTKFKRANGEFIKLSENNQYICQKKVKISEEKLRSIIKEAILMAVNEGPERMGQHRRLLNKLNKEYSDGKNPTRIYNKGKAQFYDKSKQYKTVDNGIRTGNGLKLHHDCLGMDVINTIGQDCYLTFDLYMDDKLYAKFNYYITDVADINSKRIYLKGKTDCAKFKRELYLTYNIADGTFKKPSGSSVYKFVLNTNTASPQGSHNASVMERLLQYKDIYLREVSDENESETDNQQS